MESFMSFPLDGGLEITVRTESIIACRSTDPSGLGDHTHIFISGLPEPLLVQGDYEDTKACIERASESMI